MRWLYYAAARSLFKQSRYGRHRQEGIAKHELGYNRMERDGERQHRQRRQGDSASMIKHYATATRRRVPAGKARYAPLYIIVWLFCMGQWGNI